MPCSPRERTDADRCGDTAYTEDVGTLATIVTGVCDVKTWKLSDLKGPFKELYKRSASEIELLPSSLMLVHLNQRKEFQSFMLSREEVDHIFSYRLATGHDWIERRIIKRQGYHVSFADTEQSIISQQSIELDEERTVLNLTHQNASIMDSVWDLLTVVSLEEPFRFLEGSSSYVRSVPGYNESEDSLLSKTNLGTAEDIDKFEHHLRLLKSGGKERVEWSQTWCNHQYRHVVKKYGKSKLVVASFDMTNLLKVKEQELEMATNAKISMMVKHKIKNWFINMGDQLRSMQSHISNDNAIGIKDCLQTMDHIAKAGILFCLEAMTKRQVLCPDYKVHSVRLNIIDFMKECIASTSTTDYVDINYKHLNERVLIKFDPKILRLILINFLLNARQHGREKGDIMIWLTKHHNDMMIVIRNEPGNGHDAMLKRYGSTVDFDTTVLCESLFNGKGENISYHYNSTGVGLPTVKFMSEIINASCKMGVHPKYIEQNIRLRSVFMDTQLELVQHNVAMSSRLSFPFVIWAVDDSPFCRKTLTTILQRIGADGGGRIFESPEQFECAVGKSLQNGQVPDVLLIDQNLGYGIEGSAIAGRLIRNGFDNIVVIRSGDTGPKNVSKFKKAGVDGWINKNISDLCTFVSKIETCVSRKQKRRDAIQEANYKRNIRRSLKPFTKTWLEAHMQGMFNIIGTRQEGIEFKHFQENILKISSWLSNIETMWTDDMFIYNITNVMHNTRTICEKMHFTCTSALLQTFLEDEEPNPSTWQSRASTLCESMNEIMSKWEMQINTR